ncbi:MAG: EamA family transporter [Dongiaceae bacterium]
MTPRDVALLVLVTMVWGLNIVVVKVGLAQMPPILFVALRFIVVGLLLLPVLKWPTERWGALLGLGTLLGVVHFSLFFLGVRHLDVSTTAIAIQLQVPFASLLAALFYRDRLGWRRLLGMAFAFAGVALIAGAPRADPALGSLALVVIAACIWSVASMMMKGLGDALDVLSLNGWVAIIAAPQLLIVSALTEHGQLAALAAADWRVWASALFQAVLVTLFGYSVWYRMMRRFAVNQVIPFTLLVPVFGVLSGVLILGESLTLVMLAGAALTIVGVGIIVFRRPKLVEPATKGGI